jgi:hypothetical protein
MADPARPSCAWCLGAGVVFEQMLDEWDKPVPHELLPVLCPQCSTRP